MNRKAKKRVPLPALVSLAMWGVIIVMSVRVAVS